MSAIFLEPPNYKVSSRFEFAWRWRGEKNARNETKHETKIMNNSLKSLKPGK